MAKGIIYIMSTIVSGLIKIGKTDDFERRMNRLEKNGYRNITGLKREFAIEVEDYEEKENFLQNLFIKNRVGNTELFSLDLTTAIKQVSSLCGKIIYPDSHLSTTKKTINSHNHKPKEIIKPSTETPRFYSTLTNKEYYIKRDEKGRLNLFDVETSTKVPSYNFPNTKKAITKQALSDLNVSFPQNIKVNDAIRLLRNEICNKKYDNSHQN